MAKPRTESTSAPPPRSMGPGTSDGMTCEEARDKYVDEVAIGSKVQADLSARDLGGILNDGAYLGECEVPQEAKVNICAAVQKGSAVGVTVGVDPPNDDMAKCVAQKVRGLAFPSHPKLDIVRTEF
jgi:eukaryotic-like serine/threonine-protein kinase